MGFVIRKFLQNDFLNIFTNATKQYKIFYIETNKALFVELCAKSFDKIAFKCFKVVKTIKPFGDQL